ncbi:MAG: hypothetical protein Q4A05_11165 [Ruminococcus sp.]|nr:hypothetical protein [Ruminococcus sp.]
MYEVSAEFKAALADESSQHHIKGIITDKNGHEIEIRDEIADNSVRIERQCTTDADTFAFAQIYTGTVQLELLDMVQLRRDDLRGGIVQLMFGVNDLDEWVPLGTWDITDPQRSSQRSLIINGVDGTAKLDVPITDTAPGNINIQSRMNMITELSGVRFAQSIDEILELAGVPWNPRVIFGSRFYSTCRAELNAIAQYLGCIAYIDRNGDIAFRKFGDNTERVVIPAEKRFSANLAEYSYRVAAIEYTNRYGTSVKKAGGTPANTDACMIFANNALLFGRPGDDLLDSNLTRILDNIAGAGIWVPGTLDYYGDPTIDLGDIVTLTGGINGDTSTPFLVTGYTWQFRGPMTLISAGASEQVSSGSSSGGASGGGSSGGGQTVVQKPWKMVDLESFPQVLTARWSEIGAAMFAVADETLVIAHVNVNLAGSDIGEVVIHVLLDGVMQTEYSYDTIAGRQRLTTEKNVPLTVEGGVHRLTVEAKGAATVDRIVASVYGQGVSEYTGEPTFESEYRYHADIVDEYIGSSLAPRVPPRLGGNDMHILGGGSFAESGIESVAIPDGVEEIK